jgi:hypothetical protein
MKAKIVALKEGGATLQGFADWRIASGRTRRFAVNGTTCVAELQAHTPEGKLNNGHN